MEKNNVKYCTGAKWTEEFGEIVEKYKYAKKVFLEVSNDNSEKDIITKIQNILNEKKIQNYKEFDEILSKNEVFEYENEVYFNIRKINYYFQEDSIVIINCIVIFLFKEEHNLLKYLEEFTDNEKINNIDLKFLEAKRNDEMREKSIEIINEILYSNVNKKIDENELINFFKDTKISYSGELNFNEIRILKDVLICKDSLCVPKIKGILLVFTSPEILDMNTISNAIKDINFYLGAKKDTNILSTTKVDKNYKEPKIKVILTI